MWFIGIGLFVGLWGIRMLSRGRGRGPGAGVGLMSDEWLAEQRTALRR